MPVNTSAAIRTCTQKERINHLRKTCERYDEAWAGELKEPYGRSIVDFKHKILMCAIAKSGSTTLKSLMYEASGFDIKKRLHKHNLGDIHSLAIARRYGMEWLKNINSTALVSEILQTYFTFMTIRHPFERLLSTYRCKVVDKRTDMKHIARESLKLANKTAKNTPTFNDFLTWLSVSGAHDEHWDRILDGCHPCAHNWSAIMRLETIDEDGMLLLDKLKPDIKYDAIPLRHR